MYKHSKPYVHTPLINRAIKALKDYGDADAATTLCQRAINEDQNRLAWLLLALISMNEDKYAYAGMCLRAAIEDNYQAAMFKLLELTEELSCGEFEFSDCEITDFIEGFLSEELSLRNSSKEGSTEVEADDHDFTDRFLQKLYSDLCNEKLEWSAINDDITDIIQFKDDDPWMRILEKRQRPDEYYFTSDSFGKSTLLKDESFKVSLPGNASIFLMNVASDDWMVDEDYPEDHKPVREIWVVTASGEKIRLCNNGGDSVSARRSADAIYALLEDKYYSLLENELSSIENDFCSPEPNQKVIDALTEYMADTPEE